MDKRVFIGLAYFILALVLVSCQTHTSTLTAQDTPTSEMVIDTLAPTDTIVPPTSTPFVMIDPYPPALLDFKPRPGEEISTTTGIQLVFDRPMDKESVAQSFTLSPEAEGSFDWEDATKVTFRPASLSPATRYQVSIGAEAQSQDGLRIDDHYEFAFSTVSPLVVTQITPADGTTGLRGDTEVLLAFNRPVVPINCVGEDVQANPDCLELPLTFAPSVLGRAEWVNTSIYRFTPISGWGAGERYEVTLDPGAMGIDGATLRDPVSWSFETADPRIEMVFPEPAAEQVSLESAVQVTFNTPMDQGISGREFNVVRDDETVVPGTIRWRDNGAILVFTPTEQLALDTEYAVQVSPRARARTSAPLENPFVWSFRTVPAPRLIGHTPGDGETSVGINQPIQLDFAGAIDSESLTESVRIEPEPDPSSFYAYFDEVSRVYNLRWKREPRTEYCVEVMPDLVDIYGHALDDGEIFCFVTGDLPPRLESPLAEMITMDASKPSVLYLGARNAEDVYFVLSEYDESTFISRIPSDEGEVLREWTEDFEIPLNQGQLVPLYLRRLQGALPTGLYGLEWQLDGQNYGPQHLGIAVVDRHISIKLTREEALVWATDLDNGDPITRTAVRLIDSQGLLIAGGTTDDEGLARIPISPVENLWDPVAAVIGTAGEPGFGIAMTQWSGEALPWNFGLNFTSGLLPTHRIFLETDRDLYKPGQTVHFHGLIRQGIDGVYQMPDPETQVDVILQDIEMQSIYSKTLTLSAFGSFSGSIHLEDTIALGDHMINAAVSSQGSEGTRRSFFGSGRSKQIRVEDYHKPSFHVEVWSDPIQVRQGQDLQYQVRAGYFSGGAVSNGSVEWVLSAEPYSLSDSMDLAQPGWQWNIYPAWAPARVITHGAGTLDESGMFVLGLPGDLAALEDEGAINSQRWVLKVLVTDKSQSPVSDPVSAVGEVRVHYTDMYLGLRPKSWMVRARERVEIEVQAVGWEGEPLPNREITASLIRRTWSSEDEKGSAGTTLDSVVSEVALTTDADGQALAVFNPPRSGHYIVRVEGKDAQGNDVDVEVVLWVSGDDSFAWRPTSDAVMLKPDAQTYEVGGSAQILVPVPFTETYQVLLTVERADLLKVERLVFDQPNPVIELPIEETFAPNVYVSVLAVCPGTDNRGPDVRAGYLNLSVNPAQDILDVAIEMDRSSYTPGDEARLSIHTLDHQGQPVDAEVSLSIVDKAIYTLRQSPEAQTIVEAFYGEHPLAVSSGHTLLVLINRLAEQLGLGDRFAFPEGPAGIGGAEGTDLLPGTRQNFPDTAFWDSTLRTGTDGRVDVTVNIPDSLTTWVARATAATQETQVGIAEREIEVRQPVSIHPVVPGFLVEGDRAEVVAVVHNRTTSDLNARVSVEAQGISIEGNSAQEIFVPAKGRAPILWVLNASEDSSSAATLSFSVEAGEYSDKMMLDQMILDHTIPIKRWYMPDVRGASGVLREAGTKIETLHIPISATASSALKLRLETSLAGGLVNQINYLADNSGHESTDALASRALTALASLSAMTGQETSDLEDVREARAIVAEAIECIQMRQNPDGGWGWWRDWSNLHMTSYIAMTLIQAEAAGFPLSDYVMDQALDYIEIMVTRALQTDIRYPHFALAIRVLSQADRPWPSGAATVLYRDRDQLGIAGRFHLALALGSVDPSDPRVATLLSDLRSEAKTSATGAHWEEVDSQHWATEIQVTALAVDALTDLSPEDPLLPQAVRWLMNVRRFSKWSTVYETAWASTALASYMMSQGYAVGDFDFEVAINGLSLLDEAIKAEPVAGSGSEFDLRLGSELQPGLNVLSITRESGEGTLYYASSLRLFQPVDRISSQSRGISINRQYCQALPAATSPSVSPSAYSSIAMKCSPVETVRVGDIIEARLTVVVPATRYYVLLEDLFPAGFAPIRRPDSNVEAAIRSAQMGEQEPLDADGDGETEVAESLGTGWLDPFERRAYRDSRVSFFARQLPAGTYQVSYRLRAEFPGTYHSLPATVSELYFPEVWGRTDAVTLEILPVE